MSTQQDHINQHLQIVWGNIQHNERLRNTVFNLYLIIAGFFFALLKMDKGLLPVTSIVCFSSIFIWVIGVLLLWVFSRFREMIGRDARVVRRLLERLAVYDEDNSSVWDEYDRYYASFDKKGVSKWGSVNSCLTMTISIISASVLSVGYWAYASKEPYQVGLVFILTLILNKATAMFFSWRWGVNV
jgi:hypothetical protein